MNSSKHMTRRSMRTTNFQITRRQSNTKSSNSWRTHFSRVVVAVLFAGLILSYLILSPTTHAAGEPTVYAVTSANVLIRFNAATPSSITTIGAITGLQGGEQILGIDFRPTTGELFALGSTNRLYTINPFNAAATLRAQLTAAPGDDNPFTALAGTSFGVDFNPVPDLAGNPSLRVVSNADENLRINVNNGQVTTDTNINPGGVTLAGSAYTNVDVNPATGTTLFGIDSGLDSLMSTANANVGTYSAVGAGLGIGNITDAIGFDIQTTEALINIGWAALSTDGTSSSLYRVDLVTGAATLIGTVGPVATLIRGIALEPPAKPANAFGVDTTNNLVRFNTSTPGTIVSSVPITGLQPGETVLGIDFRPATGQLYALGSTSRLYVIDYFTNPATAAATQVGTGTFSVPLNGTAFGFDFNPTVDRIRVTSDTEQNLRLNPNDGTVAASDTNLAYDNTTADGDPIDPNAGSNPDVVGSAYTNSTNGATVTTLFDIDANLDVLVLQNPPNNGVLNTVGPLGVNATAVLGFDIRETTNTAFAAMVVGTPGLYIIDLATGAATFVGNIGPGGGTALRGLAITPEGFSNTTLTGTTATFNGSTACEQISFDQSGGLLRHNRFSVGDPGFASDFDFDPVLPGDQTLSATDPSVTVIVNGGDCDDQVTIGSSVAPASGLATLFQINGQGGGDSLTIDDTASATARTITIGGGSSTITGLGGSVSYGTLERVTINAGSGGDTINIQGTSAAATNIFAGGGNDTIVFGNGATTSGGLLDGGAGANTLNYAAYASPVTVDLSAAQTLFQATLSGAQEPGPLSNSPASGIGTFTLNNAQTDLAFNIQYQGLTGSPISGTHFHNQSAGVNGPIVRGLFPAEQNGLVTPSGAFSGVWSNSDPTLTPPDPAAPGAPVRPLNAPSPVTPGSTLLQELLANRIYFNIHTLPNFPSGEIRGQIINMGTVNPATGTAGVRNFSTVEPRISISDASIVEGNSGSTSLLLTVTLSSISSQTVTVDFFTANSSATEPSDFTAVNGTVTFNPGETSKTIAVPVNGDTTPEGDETFFVNLINVVHAFIEDGQAIGTILNDDAGGTLQFSAAAYSVGENAGPAIITVTRTGSLLGTITVNFATSNVTATAGADYGNTAGTLTFGPGVTSQPITVPILNDALVEGTETLNLTLSGPTGGATLGAQSTAALSILDDETAQPDVFAVTTNNNLLRFNSNMPEVIASTVAITGLQASENVLAIDVRPLNGVLYALGSTGRLYTINTTTGAATQIGAGTFTLTGIDYGFDFNPTVDRIRVVSDQEQNFRINPDTGAVAGTDTPLNYASGDVNFGANPNVTAAAYTNNFPGATTTTLFDIDSNLDVLVRQGGVDGTPSPNGGQLSTIGSLGVNTTGLTGIDIQQSSNGAFASLTSPGETSSKLYTINLTSGAATFLGTIGGSVTIRDIAIVAGSLQFASASFSANEGAGVATITVSRSGDVAGAATVNYETSDAAGLQSCTVVNGLASERCDYVTSIGSVQFAAGETSKTFTIPLIDDVWVEGSETFTVTLTSSSGTSLPTPAVTTVTIVDNDTVAPSSNPIDGVEFFVRQQYLDFLNRLPDTIGFQNWVNTLAPCPNGGFGEPPTSNCDRLHVVSGFLLSNEFFGRGYFVFRFYMVSFNRRPTYSEFVHDMATVGGPKSPAEEEAAKVAFANAFVLRPEFTTKYPGLSGQPLADALLQTAGLPAGSYNAGAQTNGQILRGISESSAAFNKFLTEGTVSALYFALLRRDPDTIGYQNNVNTLNANPSNLRHMIFIFIYSTEYRQRFGP